MRYDSILALMVVVGLPVTAAAYATGELKDLAKAESSPSIISEYAEQQKSNHHKTVKLVVKKLVEADSNFGTTTAKQVKYDHLQVIIVDKAETLKKAITNNSITKNPYKNSTTKIEFHRVYVKNDAAHVLISTKTDLGMTDLRSIDLTLTGGRWFAVREIIFSKTEKLKLSPPPTSTQFAKQ